MAKKKSKQQILRELSQARADNIADLLDKLDEFIDKNAGQLTEEIVRKFVQSLSTDNGVILTDEANLRKVELIDKAWRTFQSQAGNNIVSRLITDIESINAYNLKYYRTLSGAQIRSNDIRNIVLARLGIDDNGELLKGGYLRSITDDVSVRNDIKNYSINKIISGAGFTDMVEGLKDFIEGYKSDIGAFKQYYRNYTYDTYTQIDRLNNTLYAEKLNLKYFIYQGTRRKNSRHFCLERKGKVYSIEESKEWANLIGKRKQVDTPKGPKRVLIGPIVNEEDAATYNPLIDLGGYNCVDVVSFVSDEIALRMRKTQVAKDIK